MELKNKTEFLSIVQRYRNIFVWLGSFILLSIILNRHLEFPVNIILAIVTTIPMVTYNVIIKNFLIPSFLHRHHVMYYVNSTIIMAVILLIAVQIDIFTYSWLKDKGLLQIPSSILSDITERQGKGLLHAKYAFLLICVLTLVTISHLLDERKRLEILTKEHQMQQELKYLRAQINPHFLFNALNCIYSLSVTKDEKAPESVLKLSDMLRYVIDDCRTDSVPIWKEISYINNFIDFQKIRMEKEPNITFDCKIENESYSIPPMIFQPVVENCFKHSRIIDNPNAFIQLSLRQEGDTITFETVNSKFSNEFNHQDNERTGIGIINVKQRLELLFGERFAFDIQEEEGLYKTKMRITNE